MKYLKNYNSFILERCGYAHERLTTLIGLNLTEKTLDAFDCSSNNLVNLIGSPKEVRGIFNCSFNELTSLEGAPKIIPLKFICMHNKLTTLKGGPNVVMENFYCQNNKLETLDYLPEIGGNLCCYGNEWIKPIPYKIMEKYGLHCLDNGNDAFYVYTIEQYRKFKSFEFQKEFLEKEPENFMDLKPIGYADGIEELFPHLFDMDELGLIN
jgi:hypothetical protein